MLSSHRDGDICQTLYRTRIQLLFPLSTFLGTREAVETPVVTQLVMKKDFRANGVVQKTDWFTEFVDAQETHQVREKDIYAIKRAESTQEKLSVNCSVQLQKLL